MLSSSTSHAPIVLRNNVCISANDARPMIFAHGFGCSQKMWRHITPAFEADYKTILFDYVGSGQSDVSAYEAGRYATLAGYMSDVLEICEELELRDAIFVGHSVSAMIGLLAALERPEFFSKLVMIAPSPAYINDGDYTGGFSRTDIEGMLEMMEKNYAGWASFLAPNIMGNADRPELSRELAESFCATDPAIARRFAEATFLSDNRAELGRNKTETLMLQCAGDSIAPPEVGAYLARHLPHSTLHTLRATGHCPHLSHPAEVISSIQDFLKDSGKGRRGTEA